MTAVLECLLAIAFGLPAHAFAQSNQVSRLAPATILGPAEDINGDPVPNAIVLLEARDKGDSRTIVTPQNGFFEFRGVKPGVPYQLRITAKDFAAWNDSPIILELDQFKIVTGIQLRIRTEVTQVQVRYDPVEVATEQLKVEEKQRVFGLIPNFYVSYETNPAPLSAKMKFQLAVKVSRDPITVTGVALIAAFKQAGNSPKYGQGWGEFGERFAAIAADGFTDIMIGGAILPCLLHQDSRYFDQGQGTTTSRIRHAMLSPFAAKVTTADGSRTIRASEEISRLRGLRTFTILGRTGASGSHSVISRSARPNALARVSRRSLSSPSSPKGEAT